MKGVRIEKSSWHYWLATKMGWKQWRRDDIVTLDDEGKPRLRDIIVEGDFCSYVRRALLGVVALTMVVLIVSAILAGFFWIEFNAWRQNYLCVFHHQCNYGQLSTAGNATLICVILVVGVLWGLPALGAYLKRRSEHRSWEKEADRIDRQRARNEARLLRQLARQNNETFMKLAYRSIKDRVCFKIKLTD